MAAGAILVFGWIKGTQGEQCRRDSYYGNHSMARNLALYGTYKLWTP